MPWALKASTACDDGGCAFWVSALGRHWRTPALNEFSSQVAGRRPARILLCDAAARGMNKPYIVAIGGSAGSIEAISTLLSGLPADFPGTLFTVVHRRAGAAHLLCDVLQRTANISVQPAEDGAEFAPGVMYIAPPDEHLIVERDRMCLEHGPMENRHRPAIDPLFRSAARNFGPRAIGVVLSGYLDDGSAGLLTIKRRGGITMVQDPSDAAVPIMPENALHVVKADYVLPVSEMAAVLTELAARHGSPATNGDNMDDPFEKPGELAAYTCPDCGGPMWEVRDGKLVRYHCRVGHSFSAESMAEGQEEAVERALWAAMRSLEERSDFSRRMAERAARLNKGFMRRNYEEQSAAARRDADVLRSMLTGDHPASTLEQHDPKLASGE